MVLMAAIPEQVTQEPNPPSNSVMAGTMNEGNAPSITLGSYIVGWIPPADSIEFVEDTYRA